MNLNARQIAELCDELRDNLRGLELIDIAPLPPRDVLLVFDGANDGKVRRLFVSSNPDASRLHLQQGRMKRGDHPIGPFYAKAIAELVGAKLRNVEQVKQDRIVAFEFQSDEGRRALYAELTGRHANLVLLDAKDEVLEVLQTAPKKAKDVRIVQGRPWKAPGGTPPPHESLPSVEDEYPAPAEDPPGRSADFAPLSWRVECGLGGQVQEKERAAKRRELLQRLKRRGKRARSRVDGLERRQQAASEIDRVQQDGELLKAALGQFERGAKSIELADWFSEDASPRRIELDPKLTPNENVERIFTRYRKLQRAAENLPAELADAVARQAEVEALVERAKDAETDPEEVEAEAMKCGVLDKKQTSDPRKKKAPVARLPYRSFQGLRGSDIWVGRSAKDNDAVSIRLSRGNDMWLHTADAPGSHVVLRMEGKGEPDDEELLDAATLAIHFSPLKAAGKADVHVARCKQVKKPRGAKPGLVTLSGGKTLQVRMQPERLKRLLDGRRRTDADGK